MARKKRRRGRPVQQQISFPTHGGARAGAGRKPRGLRAGVKHASRELLSGREPLLITLKVRPEIISLRSDAAWSVVQRALTAACERFGVRIIHFSVQHDHIHLVIEAESREALGRAMKGLSVRIARGINRVMKRKGAVFGDRYHARVLREPRQVAYALVYTVSNARRHGTPFRGALDPRSSAAAFDEWYEPVGPAPALPTIVPARTWLLRIGWRRYGPFDPWHRPGPPA